MTDTTQCNATEPTMRSPIETDRDHAIRLGVSFNGTRFIFQGYSYDKLSDAIAYAELDRLKTGQHAAASRPEEWQERQAPSAPDYELMQQHGISLEGFRYRYREYRYDRLVDALNYAGRESNSR